MSVSVLKPVLGNYGCDVVVYHFVGCVNKFQATWFVLLWLPVVCEKTYLVTINTCTTAHRASLGIVHHTPNNFKSSSNKPGAKSRMFIFTLTARLIKQSRQRIKELFTVKVTTVHAVAGGIE